MKYFGDTLFSDSPFIRWSLSPALLLSMLSLPLLVDGWTPLCLATVILLEVLCLALLSGFWLPERASRLAFRLLASLIFLSYLACLLAMVFHGEPLPSTPEPGRGSASMAHAAAGFLAIGIPCLWYAVFGRFSIKTREERAVELVASEIESLRR